MLPRDIDRALSRFGGFVPKKILLVEDRKDIRNMMAVYLTINHFQVVEAVNGAEAVELAVEHRPDLILMDVAMPVLDGIDSTKAIRQHDELRDIPIVCLTAFGDLYEERAMEAGCDEVAAKPVDFNKLDQLIRQHMS